MEEENKNEWNAPAYTADLWDSEEKKNNNQASSQ